MFGGHGLHAGKQFFGILYGAQLYFATNSQTARAYLARGMQPFRPNARQTLADYYEVPPEILDSREALGRMGETRARQFQSGTELLKTDQQL